MISDVPARCGPVRSAGLKGSLSQARAAGDCGTDGSGFCVLVQKAEDDLVVFLKSLPL